MCFFCVCLHCWHDVFPQRIKRKTEVCEGMWSNREVSECDKTVQQRAERSGVTSVDLSDWVLEADKPATVYPPDQRRRSNSFGDGSSISAAGFNEAGCTWKTKPPDHISFSPRLPFVVWFFAIYPTRVPSLAFFLSFFFSFLCTFVKVKKKMEQKDQQKRNTD